MQAIFFFYMQSQVHAATISCLDNVTDLCLHTKCLILVIMCLRLTSRIALSAVRWR